MIGSEGFLRDLALVLCVAALTTVVFQRLRQPVVLGYLLAGVIIGPHVPIPLVADVQTVQTLSELGVILLMFSIGLEFSVGRLLRLGATSVVIVIIEVGLMFWMGFMAARLLGWGVRESVLAGGILCVSSTMIVAKTFGVRPRERRLVDLVYGITIFEDLVAVVLIAVVTALAAGTDPTPLELGGALLRLLLFLAVMVVFGLLVVPRFLSFVAASASRETTLVATVGLAFAFALLARSLGYSVALGAFIAGTLASESGQQRMLELLVRPLRDLFAAIFFVSIGMLVDPVRIAADLPLVVMFLALIVIGKTIGVTLGAIATGRGAPLGIRAGMSVAQIGEFSFILAAIGLSFGPTGERLFPIAVAVSALSAFASPYLVRASGPVALFIDRRLPPALQTYETLYGTWMERLRQTRAGGRAGAARVAALMLLDTALLVAVLIAVSVNLPAIEDLFGRRLGLERTALRSLVLAAAALACLPFVLGIARAARRLAVLLALEAFPGVHEGQLDLAAAPRKALVAGLQLALLVLVGMPALALTQPFLPGLPPILLLALVLALFGFALWRSVTNLEGHVRAGAQVIIEVLSRQSRRSEMPALDEVEILLPGLGDLTPVRVEGTDRAVGRSLDELDLHSRSGAKVVCISRGAQGMVEPEGEERLRVGDVVALAGTEEEIANARSILAAGRAPEERDRDEVA
ncbi:MAG TPA: cation:proton antiporter [Planctomycetota bacterium]|nr:cation:proton antiporter [Planctomycetota bacterium]